MDFDQLFPGRFMKAGEFAGRDVVLTISDIGHEELPGERGMERRAILGFGETTKKLVLNKTNGLCCRALFGRETDDWVGKKITLYAAPIEYGDSTHAIRIKGSRDIAADIVFDLKLARKKPRAITLRKT